MGYLQAEGPRALRLRVDCPGESLSSPLPHQAPRDACCNAQGFKGSIRLVQTQLHHFVWPHWALVSSFVNGVIMPTSQGCSKVYNKQCMQNAQSISSGPSTQEHWITARMVIVYGEQLPTGRKMTGTSAFARAATAPTTEGIFVCMSHRIPGDL